jgi:hypothetical protein
MSFFNPEAPLIRIKQKNLDIQDRQGVWNIHLKIGTKTLIERVYTRIDQAFILWGAITAIIFTTAQFLPIDWSIQAMIWTPLTFVGTICTIAFTHYWAKVERLSWVVYFWSLLMMAGVAITDWGVYQSQANILVHLCPIWLGLSAVGYIATGLGLRSRALLLSGIAHLLAIAGLNYLEGWQFLATGMVMGSSLILLAEMQWDMRPPINYTMLSHQQKQFNREQQKLRQSAT